MLFNIFISMELNFHKNNLVFYQMIVIGRGY
jgi:hypothetical protein